jgi:glycosyltransferase involved in cell wall biosynthesis
MKIVSTSYINTSEFRDPEAWLNRISFHSGILEWLAKQYKVESIEQINYSGKLERNGVMYHFLDFKENKLYFPWQLHRYINQLDPDIVLINGLIFPVQVMQLRMMASKKTRIIAQHHAEKPFTGFRKLLQKQADHCIDTYLFASREAGLEWVKQGIIRDEGKINEVMEASSVFYPANKEEAIRATKVSGDPVFLWVGRLDANKDPLTVVNAFVHYVKCHPSAKLYMIYQSEELLPQVKELLSINGAMQQIELVGAVPHHELQAWYNSADFIVAGSHYEGSGIAVCEAMSCGCIPLLTDIPSFNTMTGGGNCGLLYEPGNDKELLSILLQTPAMDKSKERKKVLDQFNRQLSFEAITKKIDEIIRLL